MVAKTSGQLLCLGLGYTASHFAKLAQAEGMAVCGSHRTSSSSLKGEERGGGDAAHLFPWDIGDPLPQAIIERTTHLLLSIPPGDEGDPVYLHHMREILSMPHLEWLGYLSATSVYGDAVGGWVDETTPPAPADERGTRRLLAENQWLSLHQEKALPVHIFRLTGIYGPGRNALLDMKEGTARRLYKPGQVFSRIHVEDIAQILWQSVQQSASGEIYNCSDDNPAPSHEVVAYAAELLGMRPPPLTPIEEVEMTPMLKSFYAVSRRVANRKVKVKLGVALRYPDYRAGLQALLGTVIAN